MSATTNSVHRTHQHTPCPGGIRHHPASLTDRGASNGRRDDDLLPTLLAVVQAAPFVSVDEIAAAVGASRDRIYRLTQRLIHCGWLGQTTLPGLGESGTHHLYVIPARSRASAAHHDRTAHSDTHMLAEDLLSTPIRLLTRSVAALLATLLQELQERSDRPSISGSGTTTTSLNSTTSTTSTTQGGQAPADLLAMEPQGPHHLDDVGEGVSACPGAWTQARGEATPLRDVKRLSGLLPPPGTVLLVPPAWVAPDQDVTRAIDGACVWQITSPLRAAHAPDPAGASAALLDERRRDSEDRSTAHNPADPSGRGDVRGAAQGAVWLVIDAGMGGDRAPRERLHAILRARDHPQWRIPGQRFPPLLIVTPSWPCAMRWRRIAQTLLDTSRYADLDGLLLIVSHPDDPPNASVQPPNHGDRSRPLETCLTGRPSWPGWPFAVPGTRAWPAGPGGPAGVTLRETGRETLLSVPLLSVGSSGSSGEACSEMSPATSHPTASNGHVPYAQWRGQNGREADPNDDGAPDDRRHWRLEPLRDILLSAIHPLLTSDVSNSADRDSADSFPRGQNYSAQRGATYWLIPIAPSVYTLSDAITEPSLPAHDLRGASTAGALRMQTRHDAPQRPTRRRRLTAATAASAPMDAPAPHAPAPHAPRPVQETPEAFVALLQVARRHARSVTSTERCALAELALLLPRRHLQTLTLLAAHPWLSLADLTVALNVSLPTLSRRIRELTVAGVVTRHRLPAPPLPLPRRAPIYERWPARHAADSLPLAPRTQRAQTTGVSLTTLGWRFLARVSGMDWAALTPMHIQRAYRRARQAHAPLFVPTGASRGQLHRATWETIDRLAWRQDPVLRTPLHTAGLYRCCSWLYASAPQTDARDAPHNVANRDDPDHSAFPSYRHHATGADVIAPPPSSRSAPEVVYAPPVRGRVVWWETGGACTRRFRVGGRWYTLWPDAEGDYSLAGDTQSPVPSTGSATGSALAAPSAERDARRREGLIAPAHPPDPDTKWSKASSMSGGSAHHSAHWWLEYDTGSMNLRDLREKLALYALAAQAGALALEPPPFASAWPTDIRGRRLADTQDAADAANANTPEARAMAGVRKTLGNTGQAPQKQQDSLPLVLIVCPDYQQETLIRRMISQFLRDGSLSAAPGFRLRSTTRDLLAAGGPHDTIWLPLLPMLPAVSATPQVRTPRRDH